MICMSMRAKDRGALKLVYFTSFMPNLSTLEEQLVQSTLILFHLSGVFKAANMN